MEYLGHMISTNGIAVTTDKLEAIRSWPITKSPKKIKSFLGMTRFYRKFIHRYSHVVGPLTRLLRKDVPYVWSVECQEAFESLKDALSITPILKSPKFGKLSSSLVTLVGKR